MSLAINRLKTWPVTDQLIFLCADDVSLVAPDWPDAEPVQARSLHANKERDAFCGF
ncbi:hypothetical protein RIEGSTA812A_PEG_972 [invertebrate metagenome]|uniref:Uncharacterized protein n=1 Tax=invertebrate metagenome TaxID=1711999 RepID=A0A484H629_9ZZZZ